MLEFLGVTVGGKSWILMQVVITLWEFVRTSKALCFTMGEKDGSKEGGERAQHDVLYRVLEQLDALWS